jgi:hypothetical protein
MSISISQKNDYLRKLNRTFGFWVTFCWGDYKRKLENCLKECEKRSEKNGFGVSEFSSLLLMIVLQGAVTFGCGWRHGATAVETFVGVVLTCSCVGERSWSKIVKTGYRNVQTLTCQLSSRAFRIRPLKGIPHPAHVWTHTQHKRW